MTQSKERSTQEQKQVLPPAVSFFSDLLYFDHTDELGRPIAEMGASDLVRSNAESQGVPMRVHACPYEGGRNGRDMNVSALGVIAQNRLSVETSLVWLRQRTLGDPQVITVSDVEQLGRTGFALSAFAFNRGQNPHKRHGDLPKEIANMTKVMNGARMVAELLIEDIKVPPDRPITPRDLFMVAEKSDTFHTPDRVCPAPQQMIEELFGVLFSGTEHKDTAVVALLDREFPDVLRVRDGFAPSYSITQNELGRFKNRCVRLFQEFIQNASTGNLIQFLRRYVEDERRIVSLLNTAEFRMNVSLGRSVQNIDLISPDRVFYEIFPPELYKDFHDPVRKIRNEP